MFSSKKQFPAAAACLIFSYSAGLSPRALAAPPPDRSNAHFAGDWLGTGPMGMTCQLRAYANGHGVLVVDFGSGDLSAARIHWRNDNQAFQIEAVQPVKADPQRRIMPLAAARVVSSFNDSIEVSLPAATGPGSSCQMQRASSFDERRTALQALTRTLAGSPP